MNEIILLLVPDMVARRDDGNARSQQIDRDLGRDASPARRVLAVYDNEIDRVRFLQAREIRDHGAAARLAHHVAQKKNRQHRASIVLKSPKSNP